MSSFQPGHIVQRANEHQLRAHETQLQLVLDALPTLVSFIDADQRYRYVSAAYERWFGHATTDLIGRRLDEVVGAAAYATIKPHVERALAGSVATYDAEVRYRDGGTRWVEATYLPQRSSRGRISGFVALIADITERKAQERARTRAAARAERLLKITAAIADAVSRDQVFEAVVDHVADAIDASTAALWLLDEDGRTVTLARSRGYLDATRKQFETVTLDTCPSFPALDCIRRGEAVLIPSQATLLEHYPHLSGVTSPDRSYRVACLPLVAHGRVLGALGLTIEDPCEAAEEETEFLRVVASYASQALERLRLLEIERRTRAAASAAAERLGVLSQASRAFADSALDLDSQLQAVVVELASALNSSINVALLKPDGLLHLTAVQHANPEGQELLRRLAPTTPMRLGEGVTGGIAATGKSVLLPSIDQKFPVYALIGAPLKVRGRVIGTVTATRIRESETYTVDDLQMLEELAERAAVAIDNARLYEETLAARSTAEQLVSKLEDTIRSNELFAGVLAHDLRNPLGAIMTAAQLMLMRHEREPSTTERDARPLRRILSSGQRMTAMIDQLLDFTRARSGGGIEVDPHGTNLANLLQQAVGELELAHPEWNIHREIRGDQRGTWDSNRLLQVVSNLVGNAGQHGRQAAPIYVRLDGTERECVTLEVSNDGAIPQRLMAHLFDPFRTTQHQLDRSSGLGLGLFIVREIVHAHGGSVEVSSSEPGGTKFRIVIPRHSTRSSHSASQRSVVQAASPASVTGAADPAGRRDATETRHAILVVDDDFDIREALAEILEDRGFVVTTAANGLEALERLRTMTQPPSAILLDLMMPVMDGYGFLDACRNEPPLASIPVIVITAGRGIDRARLGDSTPVIPKPIKLPLLMNTLRQAGADGA